MKKLILISFMLLTGMAVKAQSDYMYTYDENGNRTRRYEIPPVKSPDTNDTIKTDSTNTDSISTTNNTENIINNQSSDSTQYTTHMGDQEISVFPNPTKGELKIEISNFVSGSSGAITVIDLSGRLIYQSNTVEASNIINLSSLAPGNYILKVLLAGKAKEWVVVKE
jgi:hypothetical protein